MLRVLIVEDDEASREALRDWFDGRGFDCREAGDLASAREAVDAGLPDLAVVDLDLPDGDGLELLGELGASDQVDVVMASGKATVEAAIEALRLGARDFLTKPIEMARLEAIVKSVARTADLRQQVRSLRDELRSLGRFGDMLGSSPVMQEVYDRIERVAPSGETIFLVGPTGTGKEVAATTIHRLSGRAERPFVAVNCGAVPVNLIESEFFGHERGAFTGADRRRKGRFEEADGGTLFLDEITEMPLELQVKLLRVLETSRLTRVGGTGETEVDVRIIAATNRDPHEAVAEGDLREDLLYRLMVFPLSMPPLAERGDDVVLLARTFLDELNEEHDANKTFTDAALAKLCRHDWPGNVRELRNVVRRAYLLAELHVDAEHVPLDVVPSPGGAAAAASSTDDGFRVEPGMSIAQAEQRLIEATLAAYDGNKKRSARSLGISLKTLYARLKVYAAARSSD